jgi:hypothetical protein
MLIRKVARALRALSQQGAPGVGCEFRTIQHAAVFFSQTGDSIQGGFAAEGAADPKGVSTTGDG